MSRFVEQIEALKARAAERESIRYPEVFKADAVALVNELRLKDWTQTRISDALEIPWVTLRRWREDRNETAEGPADFRPVEVVESHNDSSTVTVVAPNGWRIEGVGLDEAIEAVGRLE